MECYVPAYGCLIYCDPPYANTSGYRSGDFDSAAFWQRVRWLEGWGHTVIVSEYAAPDDFSCVWQQSVKANLRTRNGAESRTERLFRLGDHPRVQGMLWEL